jgi:hypothetical protein
MEGAGLDQVARAGRVLIAKAVLARVLTRGSSTVRTAPLLFGPHDLAPFSLEAGKLGIEFLV